MKKTLLFVICLLLPLLLCAGALAVDLPAPVAAVFETPVWAGWTPVVADEDTAAGYAGTRAAVLMQREERNVLCLLAKYGDAWIITDMTANAVYQGKRLPTLTFEGSDVLITRLTMSYAKTRGGVKEQYVFVTFEDMPWCVSDIVLTEPMGGKTSRQTRISYSLSRLTYQEELDLGGNPHFAPFRNERFYGRFQRMLRNFDINGYGRSIDSVPLYIAAPAYLAEGEQQDTLPTPVDAKLSGNGGLTVYAGPGAHYEPVENAVITGDTAVSAIAAEGAYTLVTFEGNAGLPRYGYVAYSALTTRHGLPETQFACLNATVLADDYFLDAPDTGNVVRTVAEGEQVTYLGTVGGAWSYVEIGVPTARGFIRSDALAVQYDMDVGDLTGMEPNALAVRDVRVIGDPYRRAEQTTVATLFTGTPVVFIDNLYGEWAYIEVRLGGDAQDAIRGFVPRDAVVPMGDYGLEGNG